MILAIDPGTRQSAFVVWDGDIIHESNILPNDAMLEYLDNYEYQFPHMAIEMVESFGMSVGKEVFETVWWIGRFCQKWHGTFHRVYRKEVKMHLCQSMRAKDPNIRQALIDRLGAPGTKKQPGKTYGIKADMWSALALAVTWWDKNAFLDLQPSTSSEYNGGGQWEHRES